MRHPAAILLCILGAAAAHATDLIDLPVMEPPKSDSRSGEFVFKLLPKSFQANPEFDMTIMCELTDYGRTLPIATPAHPVYYVSHDAGRYNVGELFANESTPANLDKLVIRSLSANGHLPSPNASHPPSLAIFYHWGSSNAMNAEDRLLNPHLDWLQRRERQALIGGPNFYRYLRRYASDETSNFFPLTSEQEYVINQSKGSLYYIVISAYDYAALAKNERKLVWRARLTVDSSGVALSESLPPLVLTAGTSLGRDTNGFQIVTRCAHRGKVELGPLIIVQEDVPSS